VILRVAAINPRQDGDLIKNPWLEPIHLHSHHFVGVRQAVRLEVHLMVQMRNKRMLSILLGTGIALAIGGGAYAFTASNTVPATTVGAGAGAVSGFTVTNLHYALNATTPANIDSLTFTIAPAVPSTGSGKVIIAAALSTGGPTNYTCTTDTAGTTVTCPTIVPTQLTAALLTGVTVVAAQ
jgi:hypothetical protein